jgi:uncharacterized phiE125 gp8 family phage protein
MGIKVITAPTAEPLSLATCYQHLRIDVDLTQSPPETHPDEELILAMLGAAREAAENYTGRTIAQTTLELALDEFPDAEIEIPRGPVRSISSVTYVDEEATLQTVDSANYVLDDYGDATWLLPADGYEWESTDDLVNGVKVRFVAGYAIEGESPQLHPLPKAIRAAILLTLGHLYENREDVVFGQQAFELPNGVKSLLAPYRVEWGV